MHKCDTNYQAALKEHQAGNLDVAAGFYQEILNLDPNNSDVLHLYSILFAQKGDFLRARQLMEKALSISPESPTFHNSMGNVLKNLKNYDGAILHYQKSIKLQPRNASAHNNLGNVFYALERLQEAEQEYRKAICLRENYADAYCNLGLVLIKQKNEAGARKCLEKVIALQPEHSQAQQNLAHILQLEGEIDAAARHYQKAIRLRADNVFAHHNLGVILFGKNKIGAAVWHFQRVLKFEPDHTESLHNLGSIFLLQNNLPGSLQCFLKLLKVDPSFDVYYNLGVIYMDLARFDDAITYFEEALKINANDFSTFSNLGTIYLRKQDYIAAEKYYAWASKLQPNNEEVGYILAAIRQNGDRQKAPAEYVEHLFDKYAPHFDEHLKLLDYCVPQLLYDAVCEKVRPAAGSLVVLDLGCGTGLSGVKFKEVAARLVGIDISPKMLEVARLKNVYDDLQVMAFEDLGASFSDIDLVVAADSLVYVGDLDRVFSDVMSLLKGGGAFAFTLEKTASYPYLLQRSARFAHNQEYVLELAARHEFTVAMWQDVVLRKQYDGKIEGNLYLFLSKKS